MSIYRYSIYGPSLYIYHWSIYVYFIYGPSMSTLSMVHLCLLYLWSLYVYCIYGSMYPVSLAHLCKPWPIHVNLGPSMSTVSIAKPFFRCTVVQYWNIHQNIQYITLAVQNIWTLTPGTMGQSHHPMTRSEKILWHALISEFLDYALNTEFKDAVDIIQKIKSQLNAIST